MPTTNESQTSSHRTGNNDHGVSSGLRLAADGGRTDGGQTNDGQSDGGRSESRPTGQDGTGGDPSDRDAVAGERSREDLSDVEREERIDYLDVEINLLKPATPFMRDHLRIIWIGFGIWTLSTFGPITATRIAPDLMTQTMPILGFPLHYFLIAIGAPMGALILSVWYARRRDQIDRKYGIEQRATAAPEAAEAGAEDAAATDGGVDR